LLLGRRASRPGHRQNHCRARLCNCGGIGIVTHRHFSNNGDHRLPIDLITTILCIGTNERFDSVTLVMIAHLLVAMSACKHCPASGDDNDVCSAENSGHGMKIF
jgi:hypothetical protein